MPTLILADNFSHRSISVNRHLLGPATGERGIWVTVGNAGAITFDAAKVRDNRGSLQFAENGVTATFARKGITAGIRTLVGAMYFLADANPSVNSRFLHFPLTNFGYVRMNTTGSITYGFGGTDQTIAGTFADGAWHRCDFYVDTTTTTYTLDVSIDGVAGTQASRVGQTAADMGSCGVGSNETTGTLTFWAQDLVLSATAGDHPINTIFVRSLDPNGDGTHNISGAGDFDKGDGTDILVATSDAWGEVDDWVNAAADDVTYVQATAAASTEYTEHTLGDVTPLETTIYDVFGYTATLANAGTAGTANLTVRVVDSAGTTLTDILANEDVTDTTSHFNFSKITAPGGTWDQTELNGLKVRVGLSTVVTNLPRCSAVHVQYVTPDVGGFPIEGASFPGRRSFVG